MDLGDLGNRQLFDMNSVFDLSNSWTQQEHLEKLCSLGARAFVFWAAAIAAELLISEVCSCNAHMLNEALGEMKAADSTVVMSGPLIALAISTHVGIFHGSFPGF